MFSHGCCTSRLTEDPVTPPFRSTAPRRTSPAMVRLPLAASGQRIGLLGGSFNPPHAGHIHISRVAATRLGLDRIWWLVTPGNPLKANLDLPPVALRLASARALARDPRILVTGLEAGIGSPYTVDTIALLRARLPGVRFVWIMGADNLAEFHNWRNWRALAGLVPLAIVDRPGWRLKALSAPAARILARWRVPQSRAGSLASMRPPAWLILTSRLSAVSSTALRSAENRA